MKEITVSEAERIQGKRLDRRRKYALRSNESEHELAEGHERVWSIGRWTQSCSGCYETNEGYAPRGTRYDKNGVALGSGCKECGYHGKVAVAIWAPHVTRKDAR